MPNPADVAWDDWLLLGIQIATLAVLLIYVWKTWEMAAATRRAAEAAEQTLKEARESRIEELAPAILVYFDSSPHGGAEIVIENAGRGAAAEVSLTFDPLLQTTQPHDTDRFFDATQSLIPPGYRIAQLFDVWPALLASDLPKSYAVTVRYRGVQTGRTYEHLHHLNAEALRHRLIGRNKGLHEIVEELEEWRKADEQQARQQRQDAYKRLFQAPMDAPLPENAVEAVQFMLGRWRLQRVLREDPGAFVPTLPLVHAIRRDVLTVFRFVPAAELSQESVRALNEVAAAAFSREAELMGGSKVWMDKMEETMALVEEAFSS